MAKKASISLSQWLDWVYLKWRFVCHFNPFHKKKLAFSCLTAPQHQQNSLHQRNTTQGEICAQYPLPELQTRFLLAVTLLQFLLVCLLRLSLWATETFKSRVRENVMSKLDIFQDPYTQIWSCRLDNMGSWMLSALNSSFSTLRNTERAKSEMKHTIEGDEPQKSRRCKTRRHPVNMFRNVEIFFIESSPATDLRVSLTAAQTSSWGRIKRVEPQPFGPTPSTSRCPATPWSAGSSATCCTKCCGVATET